MALRDTMTDMGSTNEHWQLAGTRMITPTDPTLQERKTRKLTTVMGSTDHGMGTTTVPRIFSKAIDKHGESVEA